MVESPKTIFSLLGTGLSRPFYLLLLHGSLLDFGFRTLVDSRPLQYTPYEFQQFHKLLIPPDGVGQAGRRSPPSGVPSMLRTSLRSRLGHGTSSLSLLKNTSYSNTFGVSTLWD